MRVLEKHADFFRDFRGDTVHPSTMEILDQLGMLGRFLDAPARRVQGAQIRVAGRNYTIGDLSHLDTPAPFIAMMPQWEFLDFLRDEAEAFAGFALEMEAEVTGFVEDGGRIAGVATPGWARASGRQAVLMTDGRASLVRRLSLLPVEQLGAPMDVLWFAPAQGRQPRRQAARRGRHRPPRGADRPPHLLAGRAFDPQGGGRGRSRRAASAGCASRWRACCRSSTCQAGWKARPSLHLLSVALDRLDPGTGPACWRSATRRTR